MCLHEETTSGTTTILSTVQTPSTMQHTPAVNVKTLDTHPAKRQRRDSYATVVLQIANADGNRFVKQIDTTAEDSALTVSIGTILRRIQGDTMSLHAKSELACQTTNIQCTVDQLTADLAPLKVTMVDAEDAIRVRDQHQMSV